MPTKADLRRLNLREELWPGSAPLVAKPDEKGWWRAPRTLPLILSLTRDRRITENLDCSSVYLELLSRDFGQGFVEIFDEDEHAFCAGYFGNRALRSWRERIDMLEKAGFIKVAPKGNRRIGYVLLVDPHAVAENLHSHEKTSEAWWRAYRHRLQAVGAVGPAPAATPFFSALR
jgi:hypothetical protein